MPKSGAFRMPAKERHLLESPFIALNGHASCQVDYQARVIKNRPDIPEAAVDTEGELAHYRINDIVFDGDQEPL